MELIIKLYNIWLIDTEKNNLVDWEFGSNFRLFEKWFLFDLFLLNIWHLYKYLRRF